MFLHNKTLIIIRHPEVFFLNFNSHRARVQGRLLHLLFLSMGGSRMIKLALRINIILALEAILLYIGFAEEGPCEL